MISPQPYGINSSRIDDLGRIATLIKKELVTAVDPVRLESNLAAIINILAREDWNRNDSAVETIPFNIDHKIDHNKLDAYARHYRRLLGPPQSGCPDLRGL